MDTIRLTYLDLLGWAGVNAGNFGNEKSLIMWSKQVRWELLEQRNLNAADAVLLSHLNALAAEPIHSMPRGPSLAWGLAHLRACLPAHVLGPRRRHGE